jgi:hypothetical protein
MTHDTIHLQSDFDAAPDDLIEKVGVAFYRDAWPAIVKSPSAYLRVTNGLKRAIAKVREIDAKARSTDEGTGPAQRETGAQRMANAIKATSSNFKIREGS